MAKKQRSSQRRIRLAGILMGVIIVVSTMLSLLAPNLRNRSSSNDSVLPATPEPTKLIVPTPDPNPQLDGAAPYIHSSGFFQTFQPAGRDWQAYETVDLNTPPYSGIVIQSQARLAVIHNYLHQGVTYETLESLSEEYWTQAEINENWGNYDTWAETRREITANYVIIDFALSLDENNYLGRTTSWTNDSFLYVSRLVVPANNPELLELLFEKVTPAFTGYSDLQALPQTWPVYQDRTLGFALKYPSSWSRIAGGAGRTTTFQIPLGQVRVWAEADQPLESAKQAEQWISETETDVTILQTEAIERTMGTGYQVAYTYRDTAGDLHSGLVALLIGPDGTRYIANAQIETPEVNLLAIDATVAPTNYETRRAISDGFIVLPGNTAE